MTASNVSETVTIDGKEYPMDLALKALEILWGYPSDDALHNRLYDISGRLQSAASVAQMTLNAAAGLDMEIEGALHLLRCELDRFNAEVSQIAGEVEGVRRKAGKYKAKSPEDGKAGDLRSRLADSVNRVVVMSEFETDEMVDVILATLEPETA